MRKKIFHSFLTLTCLVLAIFTAVLVLGVYQMEQRQLESSLQSETEMLASVVAGSDDGAAQLERLALDRRVTLVNADGSVAFDNYASAATLENHGGREEIVQAHTSGEATVRRNSGTLAEEMVYHTKLLKNGQVLRVAAPQRTVWGLLSSFLPWVIGMLILAVLLAALLSARATKALIAPIAAIDPEHPLDNESYEELTPLLRRLYLQQEESVRQMSILRMQKEEQEALLSHMREGLVVLDGRQRIVTMNGAAHFILSVPEPLPERATLLEVNRNVVLQELLQRLETSDTAHAAMDAEGRHYYVSASRVGQGEGSLLLLQDDTADHEAEEGRRQFTANVSHELRTPLTTISGYAELLENHLAASPEDEEKFLSLICKEAGRMLLLVEDILRLSQLDEGTLELKPQPVDVKRMAEDTVAALAAKAERRDVRLSVSGHAPEVTTDATLLSEVLYNLLDNAIKYNRPGGQAEILLDDVNGHVRIRVKDTGIGIPKEHQQKVFERFYRVDKSRSKATGGTGLGLSIVKHAAQILSADLRLDSTPDQGTTVTVTL